jgi:hypothetical protein
MCPTAYKQFKQMIADVRAGNHLGEPAGHPDINTHSDAVRQVQTGIAMKPDRLRNMQFKHYTEI